MTTGVSRVESDGGKVTALVNNSGNNQPSGGGGQGCSGQGPGPAPAPSQAGSPHAEKPK